MPTRADPGELYYPSPDDLKWVRERMEERRIGVQDLAKAAGVTRQAIYQLLNGITKRTPRWQLIVRALGGDPPGARRLRRQTANRDRAALGGHERCGSRTRARDRTSACQEVLKLTRPARYACVMAVKAKVVDVARVVDLLRGDDRAIDLILRMVTLLSERRAAARKRR